MLVHTAAFSCEAALVAVTLLKLFTEAQDPRFAGTDAAAVRQYRINVGVTAVSFAFTAVAFVGTVAGFGTLAARLRGAARRISARCTASKNRRGSGTPAALQGVVTGQAAQEPLQPTHSQEATDTHNTPDTECGGVDAAHPGSAMVPLVEAGVASGVHASPLDVCVSSLYLSDSMLLSGTVQDTSPCPEDAIAASGMRGEERGRHGSPRLHVSFPRHHGSRVAASISITNPPVAAGEAEVAIKPSRAGSLQLP